MIHVCAECSILGETLLSRVPADSVAADDSETVARSEPGQERGIKIVRNQLRRVSGLPFSIRSAL